MPSLADLTKRREVVLRDDEKQALLARLWRDIHLREAARQSERIERRRAAGRLARLGFVLTKGLVAVLVGLGPQADSPASHQLLAQYNLAVTTGFGVLRAYVSRLVASRPVLRSFRLMIWKTAMPGRCCCCGCLWAGVRRWWSISSSRAA